MPAKHSERLKEAIQYIRSGEKEIAREIILEIIQSEPEYEKAWIWLLETVTERSDKIEILKARLEQFPDTSQLSRLALEKIAPEVLEAIVPADEAIIYPPGMEPRDDTTEDEIQYNVSINEGVENRFGFDDNEDLIQMASDKEDDSPLDENPFKSDLNPFLDDDLFAELPTSTDDDEQIEFNLFEDVEGEELQQQDLDLFLQDQEKVSENPSEDDNKSLDFDAWLMEETQNEEPKDIDSLAELLNEEENESRGQSASPFADFDIDDIESSPQSTGKSDPFILDEDSQDIFTESQPTDEEESQSLEDLFRGASTEDLTPEENLFGESLFDDDSADKISQEDILAASDSFQNEIPGDPIPPLESRPSETAAPGGQSKKGTSKKKKKEDNSTFVFGCSIMAAILFISIMALGFLILRNANNPKIQLVTTTPTATSTITPTVTVPLVAPWLTPDNVNETPTPESSIQEDVPDILGQADYSVPERSEKTPEPITFADFIPSE